MRQPEPIDLATREQIDARRFGIANLVIGVAGDGGFSGHRIPALPRIRAREVRADLGQAFDLTLQRTRKDLQLDADRLGLVERIELVLRNAKAEPATVRVHESLPRWTDWEIVESSAQWNKADAQTVHFDVAVPAKGEATVSYAVRYRWPDSMKP